MEYYIFRKSLTFAVIFLFLGINILPIINGKNEDVNCVYSDLESQTLSSIFNGDIIDLQFVYSITENLSRIIFTEYNESAGELAKGRAFGSKGEHKAAQILYENMTSLGLITEMERLDNTPKDPNLISAYDVLNYGLTLKNTSSGLTESVDCCINAIKPESSPVHEEIYTFDYKDVKILQWPRTFREWFDALIFNKKGEKYVFLYDVGDVVCRNPEPDLTLDIKLIRKIFYPISNPSLGYNYFRRDLVNNFLVTFLDNCVGRIPFDFTNDTHDTAVNKDAAVLPRIFINGTICRKIASDIKNFTVDFHVREMYNESVVSYNVIGLLKGKNSDKTVIVDCLYDSVMCQGTGDAALGMGIVMGIAKYFTDNYIVPEYDIKFIGFGGEETGFLGSSFYETTHEDEDIKYVIDMNQVCSAQLDPPLTLNVIFNSFGFMNEVWPVVDASNYPERVSNASIAKRWWPTGAPSDDFFFAIRRPFRVKTVCFLEDFPWIMHHRDGLNHTAGDVFDEISWDKVRVTSEIVLNVVKFLTIKNQPDI